MSLFTKRNIIIGASALVVVLAGTAVFRRGSVATVRPRVGPIVDAVYALGTVKSEHVFNMRLSINDGVQKLYVAEGDEVRRGAPLLRAESGVPYYSPITGTVTRLVVNEGENIQPGVTVLTIMDLARSYVLISLDQESAVKVRKGQKAELSFEGLRRDKFAGVIDSIYPSAGQFYAKIRVERLPASIQPEMNVDVIVEIARREKALMIPARAVADGAVTVVRRWRRLSVRVKMGAVNDEWIEVLDGAILPTDDVVVPQN